MALKPGTIKALFGKLAGQYGDDVIEGVAKYGDDAYRMAYNYGDDVMLKAMSDGDLGSLKRPFEVDNILNSYDLHNEPWFNFNPNTTKFLGNPVEDITVNSIPRVKVPNLPTDGLVKEYLQISDVGSPSGVDAFVEPLVRPHRNTALGRWFRQQMSKKV